MLYFCVIKLRKDEPNRNKNIQLRLSARLIKLVPCAYL